MKYFINKLKKQKNFTSAKVQTPIATPERHKIAIACILKDEEAYILEWVNFHAINGIKDFIIYDDGSKDETVKILQDLQQVNIKIIP